MADPLKLAALMAVALPAPDAPDWEAKMRSVITRGHLAAWMAGTAERLGVKPNSPLLSEKRLSRAERAEIKAIVEKQLTYLKGFVEARGDMSDAAIAARAQMYSGAVRGSYSAARWGDIPLPFQPTEGSECLTNCRCSWDIQQLDGDGNYDAYWRFGDTEKHCATCPEREAASPYRIRDGVLQ